MTPFSGKPSAPIKLINARIIDPSRNLDAMGAVLIVDGHILAASPDAASTALPAGGTTIDCKGSVVAPGLVDMKVFVGEPGAEHRETLASASQAAAAGGVTTIVTMPNTNPVIDDIALVDYIQRRARDTAVVHVLPMAALTKGTEGENMTEIGLLKEAGAVGFTDGRKAIRNSMLMRRALTYARDFGALVVNHPEDPELRGHGVMNEGESSTRYGLLGIPHEAETIMLARDLALAKLTNGRYHAGQLSTAEGVEAVRRAKAEGLTVSAGVSINHLTLNENDIGTWRSFLKLSPPLRTEDDRLALIEGVRDGTIDVVVSAHDPQDSEMKRHPFQESADGAVGLETLLPAGLRLVHDGSLTLMRLVEALSTAPARLLGLPSGTLRPGAMADIIVFDPDEPWVLDRRALKSRSKNTAFEEARFTGKVKHTLVAGTPVYP